MNARHASTLILIKLELLVIYVEDLKLVIVIGVCVRASVRPCVSVSVCIGVCFI